jgi:uncharacterized membrane protein
MNYIYITLLVLSIILKFFTPKQPNNYFGYQLGSAKKSTEHWRLANKYASNYMIVLCAIVSTMAFIFEYFSYENELLLALLLFLGYAIIYFRIEKILKDKIG